MKCCTVVLMQEIYKFPSVFQMKYSANTLYQYSCISAGMSCITHTHSLDEISCLVHVQEHVLFR